MEDNHVFDMIRDLYERFGGAEYMIGEPITQTEHAIQSMLYARSAGAPPYLQVAALLHDIGHFLNHPVSDPTETDDRHELVGAKYLAYLGFPPSVFVPVMMHADAKRYLVTMDKAYAEHLTEASRKSFYLQGGSMSSDEIRLFEASPYLDDALALREADDNGKELTNPILPNFESMRELVVGVLASE